MSDETENAADDVLEAKFAALTTRARRTCRELSWTFYTVSEVQPHNKVNVLVAKNNERIGNDGSAQRVDDDKQNCDDDVVCREGGGRGFWERPGLGREQPFVNHAAVASFVYQCSRLGVWAFGRLGVQCITITVHPVLFRPRSFPSLPSPGAKDTPSL